MLTGAGPGDRVLYSFLPENAIQRGIFALSFARSCKCPALTSRCKLADHAANQGTNQWHPLESVRSLLDANPTGYQPFDGGATATQSQSTTSSSATRGSDVWPKPPPPGFKDPQAVSKEVLRHLLVFLDGQLMLLKVSSFAMGVMSVANTKSPRPFLSGALRRALKWLRNW